VLRNRIGSANEKLGKNAEKSEIAGDNPTNIDSDTSNFIHEFQPFLLMTSQFSILDVSAEFIMDVAKVVASSPKQLSKDDLMRCFNKSKGYITNAISQCVQLGLVLIKNGSYTSSERHRDLLKRSERSQLYLPFREALQRYPPFLLYVDFISKKYPSDESATITSGIFQIESSEKIVEKSLRKWGIFSQLIRKDSNKRLSIPEAEKGLPSQYVKGLLKALGA